MLAPTIPAPVLAIRALSDEMLPERRERVKGQEGEKKKGGGHSLYEYADFAQRDTRERERERKRESQRQKREGVKVDWHKREREREEDRRIQQAVVGGVDRPRVLIVRACARTRVCVTERVHVCMHVCVQCTPFS